MGFIILPLLNFLNSRNHYMFMLGIKGPLHSGEITLHFLLLESERKSNCQWSQSTLSLPVVLYYDLCYSILIQYDYGMLEVPLEFFYSCMCHEFNLLFDQVLVYLVPLDL